MGADTVKIFCPKCQCVYHPPPVRSRSSHHGGAGAAGVDGAAFGTTFPHLFLMTFSNLVPDPLPQDSSYVPRVFGFRVHSSTRQRAGSGATASASSAARQVDNNKRLAFVGRRSEAAVKESTEQKIKKEEAEPAQDGNTGTATQEAARSGGAAAAAQKAKSAPVSSKQARGTNEDNAVKDEEGSKKTKTGKRKNDGDSASKKSEGNGSANMDNSSKRRRKTDNGNA